MKVVVVVTLNGYNGYNRSLISNIRQTADCDVVLGWDEKSGHKAVGTKEFISSYASLNEIYGHKIDDFNGRWKENPSKLGAIHWFSTSKYDYMWLFEDDVYVKNCRDFVQSYAKDKADIICKQSSTIPGWAKGGWRVGDKTKIGENKDFAYSHLYASRYSKKAAVKILEELVDSDRTNHHELWIPYVACKAQLTTSDLHDFHKLALSTNPTENSMYMNKNIMARHFVQLFDICHPYKQPIAPVPNVFGFVKDVFSW